MISDRKVKTTVYLDTVLYEMAKDVGQDYSEDIERGLEVIILEWILHTAKANSKATNSNNNSPCLTLKLNALDKRIDEILEKLDTAKL